MVVLEIERERRRNGTILSIASSTERNPLTSRSPSAQPTAATTLSGLRSGLQPFSGVPVGGGYHAQQWWMVHPLAGQWRCSLPRKPTMPPTLFQSPGETMHWSTTATATATATAVTMCVQQVTVNASSLERLSLVVAKRLRPIALEFVFSVARTMQLPDPHHPPRRSAVPHHPAPR